MPLSGGLGPQVGRFPEGSPIFAKKLGWPSGGSGAQAWQIQGASASWPRPRGPTRPRGLPNLGRDRRIPLLLVSKDGGGDRCVPETSQSFWLLCKEGKDGRRRGERRVPAAPCPCLQPLLEKSSCFALLSSNLDRVRDAKCLLGTLASRLAFRRAAGTGREDSQPDSIPSQLLLAVKCTFSAELRGEAKSKKAPLEGGLGG